MVPKVKILVKIILIGILISSCTPPTAPLKLPNVKRIDITNSFWLSSLVWGKKEMFMAKGLVRVPWLETINGVELLKDTDYNFLFSPSNNYEGVSGFSRFPVYISNGMDENHLLFTSCYSTAIYGGLGEIDLTTIKRTMYLDSSYAISSAIYKPQSERYIYFYTFGSDKINAGYYLYDKEEKKYEKIMEYTSDIRTYESTGEFIHGFDVRHDGKKLLIPISMKGEQPLMVEYDITTKKLDTIGIKFEYRMEQQCLWLRYNNDGTKILYSSYPEYYKRSGHYKEANELGVYDMKLKKKTIIPVSPKTYGDAINLNINPVWSPDNKHILYGTTWYTELGGVGSFGGFSPYIFEDVAGYIESH